MPKYVILEGQAWEDFKQAHLHRFYRREFPNQTPPELTTVKAVRLAFPDVFGED